MSTMSTICSLLIFNIYDFDIIKYSTMYKYFWRIFNIIGIVLSIVFNIYLLLLNYEDNIDYIYVPFVCVISFYLCIMVVWYPILFGVAYILKKKGYYNYLPVNNI
jgi:hypothetical protein